eukprot:GHVU01210970.1.p1 GENE.GHVU01210970.1~~GHVU01210970.1.p1  ORF type:complete len:688 (-),score=148.45 GHVU01210970.1:577-2640(-)
MSSETGDGRLTAIDSPAISTTTNTDNGGATDRPTRRLRYRRRSYTCYVFLLFVLSSLVPCSSSDCPSVSLHLSLALSFLRSLRPSFRPSLPHSFLHSPQLLERSEVDYEPINRWWEKTQRGGIQWEYLEHRGIMATPIYEPHGIRMLYDGEPVEMPPEAEEVATFWAQCLETDKAEKEVFQKNFWKSFLEKVPSENPIKRKGKHFDKCDFTPIKNYLDAESAKKKEMTTEEKNALKLERQRADAPYTHGLVDWIREKIPGYKVEPPQLFRGRGEHPKQGLLKRRIVPNEVTINISEDAPVPPVEPHMQGYCWKDVFHDPTVAWLSFYKDSVNNNFKYQFLSNASAAKGQKDMEKYEKARDLKGYIDKIRKDYTEKMSSNDETEKQLGTATYLIDFLALRVGGDKDTDNEADTVGCCSLRMEHIAFNDEAKEITLDFLGKDSIRYNNTVHIKPRAYENLKGFAKRKKNGDSIFDKISTASLNKYLKELMPGLSAKVFRTYNASITLQSELDKLDPAVVKVSDPDQIASFYDQANRAVAILCNHQRTVPKQHAASMEKLSQQLADIDADVRDCEILLENARTGKAKKLPKREEVDGKPAKSAVKEGMSEQQLTRKMITLKSRRDKMDARRQTKEDNKEVALSTSKINYMDPRITIAFCKKLELPVEKVFSRGVRDKFPWAMYAKRDFVF